MISEYRKLFNENFSEEKYQSFLDDLMEGYPTITF